jgi:hypothetical protein
MPSGKKERESAIMKQNKYNILFSKIKSRVDKYCNDKSIKNFKDLHDIYLYEFFNVMENDIDRKRYYKDFKKYYFNLTKKGIELL